MDIPQPQAAEPGDQSRAMETHHYGFAHRLLPALFGEAPEASVQSLYFMDEAWLLDLWREGLLPSLQASGGSPIGLACELLTHREAGLTLALFTLPEPWFVTGAHFTAAVLAPPPGSEGPRDFSYWTLERGRDWQGETYAVLGQWRDGTHLNLGPAPAASRETFLGAILGRLAPGLPGLTLEPGPRLQI